MCFIALCLITKCCHCCIAWFYMTHLGWYITSALNHAMQSDTKLCYITNYKACYIMSETTCALYSSALSKSSSALILQTHSYADPCASAASVSLLPFVKHPLSIFYACSPQILPQWHAVAVPCHTATSRGWACTAYLRAVASPSAGTSCRSLAVAKSIGRVDKLFPPKEHCIIGTRPSMFSALQR